MTTDVFIGDALVYALILAPWLLVAVPSGLLGAGLAWWAQQRRRGGVRHQRAEAARLRTRLAASELAEQLGREATFAAVYRAQRVEGLAACLSQDVVALQHQLGRALDGVRLAELELRTEWEGQP